MEGHMVRAACIQIREKRGIYFHSYQIDKMYFFILHL